MVRAFILLVSIAIGTDANADSDCVNELLFGVDGRTTKWTICNTNTLKGIVESNSGRFEITLSAGDDRVRERLQWTQIDELSADRHEFRALNLSHTIELTRHISDVSPNGFVQTISVKNLSPDDVSDIRLHLHVGRSVGRD